MPQSLEVLLVEDEPMDARLTRKTVEWKIPGVHVSTVIHGQQALDYLTNRGEYEASKKPDVIILDLALPMISGREIFGIVKQHPDLQQIPIIILTGQEVESRLLKEFESYNVRVLNKWNDLETLSTVIQEYQQ